MERQPAILLMGPTASGKTGLAIELARALPVEIVSVDSALVYREMDIGTAKPSRALRAQVPHHLVDLVDPAESYSAGRFRREALAVMEAIRARGRVPLLVGGTMMYFRALQRGLAELPPASPALRAELDREAATLGWPALHARLAEVDPVAAARIQPGDSQRIQRALEVWQLAGRPLSEFAPGDQARVLELKDNDPRLLQYLGESGILPDVELEIIAVEPFDGPVTVRIGTRRVVVGRAALSQVLAASPAGAQKREVK